MAKRGGKRRDPAKEQFWRRVIQRQQRSGLAVTDFCRRERFKDGAFRWWRKELARRDRQAPSTLQARRDGIPAEAAPSFLPVRVIDLEFVIPRTPVPIEIMLPSGPTVRVPTGFDPPTLGAVLSVLEGRPC